MLLKIVYLLTCRVLGVAVLVFRGDRAKAAESAPASSSHHGPTTPVADLSQERVKRRPVLGGLLNEYERTA